MVVLPAPFGPRKANSSPGPTSKLMSSTAGTVGLLVALDQVVDADDRIHAGSLAVGFGTGRCRRAYGRGRPRCVSSSGRNVNTAWRRGGELGPQAPRGGLSAEAARSAARRPRVPWARAAVRYDRATGATRSPASPGTRRACERDRRGGARPRRAPQLRPGDGLPVDLQPDRAGRPRGGSRGDRPDHLRRSVGRPDARDAPDDVRRAARARPGRPRGVCPGERRPAAPSDDPAARLRRDRRRSRPLAGRGRGRDARRARAPRRGDGDRDRPGRAAPPRADPGRRGQALGGHDRRLDPRPVRTGGGGPDHPGPTARVVDQQPVPLDDDRVLAVGTPRRAVGRVRPGRAHPTLAGGVRSGDRRRHQVVDRPDPRRDPPGAGRARGGRRRARRRRRRGPGRRSRADRAAGALGRAAAWRSTRP